jgi:membrane associated rhomboid family serine protease
VSTRFGGASYPYRISFGPPFTPVIKGLIIANVAVHLLQWLAGAEATLKIQDLLALDPGKVLREFWLWQPLTYQFLHHQGDIMHLVFNMLMLWMFGGDLEQRWGARRFLRFYMVCGTGAGVVTCVVNALLGIQSATIGASGAIFGLLMAFGILFPNRVVLFLGLFPMRARVMVALFAVIQIWAVGGFRTSGIAYFAHLGGMLVAWLYLSGWWDPRRAVAEVRWRVRRRRFQKLESARDEDETRDFYH